ncbi:hypothetical protein C8R45DRAFT_1091421 [Mycena sanguinolenta]|nr:hypothetical protein C8R45DRAFT_1091421 [Mycena sanguinolenta]
MHINVVFVATALLASASTAMSAQIAGFAGADCTGSVVFSNGASSDECLTLGGGSVRSIGYSGVPSQIQFFESGGSHDSCTNGPQSHSTGLKRLIDARLAAATRGKRRKEKAVGPHRMEEVECIRPIYLHAHTHDSGYRSASFFVSSSPDPPSHCRILTHGALRLWDWSGGRNRQGGANSSCWLGTLHCALTLSSSPPQLFGSTLSGHRLSPPPARRRRRSAAVLSLSAARAG